MAKKKEAKPLNEIEAKRVAIAKDAIAQIQAEKYDVLARNGYVVSYDLNKNIQAMANSCELFTGKSSEDTELKEYLDTLLSREKCEVCAKGALFLSSIRKFNNFSLKEAADMELNASASSKIQEIFGVDNADKLRSTSKEMILIMKKLKSNGVLSIQMTKIASLPY